MEATNIDHSLVVVDEFDALSIEINEFGALDAAVSKKYPAKLHARKVAKIIGAQDGIIYLPGQWETTFEDSDQGPPFRQRRYFYYLSGADFPGCSVTYDIAADKLTLWIPYTAPATILWFGNTPSAEDCLSRFDVHDVKYSSQLSKYLTSRLSHVKTLYVLRSSQLPKFDGLDQLKPRLHINTTALQPAMDEARVIKTDYEIAMIRKANAVSSEAHRHVARSIYGMENECVIEATFLGWCTARNAHTRAYSIIAGSGANASTLHYDTNNEPLAGRQLVVLDAGAEWNCYASDVTRTLPLGTSFSSEARAIYEIVHQMQDECIERIRPGTVFRDLQLHATRVAVEGLLKIGIFRNGSVDEIFKNGTAAAFFPHGLGHHVGLDVHDVLSKDLVRPAGESMWGKRRPVGPHSVRAMINQTALEQQQQQPPQKDKTASPQTKIFNKLEPNMIVTIEPGLYFCKPYIEAYFLRSAEHSKYIDADVLDRFWDVGGVRIEDCILVTENGYENLTTAPKGEELLRIVGVATS
ncbi:metallopeptidase family M24-domain-containing protein [Xylariaceae sp. FL0255]|nr:metallopeptidase family M24-domain-containing protein [Xylariaceae sp. FL0255]